MKLPTKRIGAILNMYLMDDDAICKPKLTSTSFTIRGSRCKGDDLELPNMPKTIISSAIKSSSTYQIDQDITIPKWIIDFNNYNNNHLLITRDFVKELKRVIV